MYNLFGLQNKCILYRRFHLQMTLNKMVVLLTASLFCSAAAIFHQPYYPAAEQYNYTGKWQYL